ncbi:MAG: hypothetical protein GF331_05415 [Chitinivibrionales bacterium]|nr:hypothetical protein [Chitinivibrionales bacterium]
MPRLTKHLYIAQHQSGSRLTAIWLPITRKGSSMFPTRTSGKEHRVPIAVVIPMLMLLAAAVCAQSRKLAISPMGNSITGSFDRRASYRYYIWQTLVDSGFAVKGEEKVDFVGWYCGVDDQGIPGACGNPKYDSTVWDWDHDGLHASPTSWLATDIARVSAIHATQDLGYPGHHIVMLHMGTNDVLNLMSLDQAKENIRRGIDTLRAYNPNVIIILAQIIPGISPYSYPVEDSFPVFNAYVAELSVEEHLPSSPIYLVDQYTGYEPQWMNGLDGIHPLDTGERWIAGNFQDVLVPILEEIADPPTVRIEGGGTVAGHKWIATEFTAVVHSDVETVYPNSGIASVGLYLGDTFVGQGTPVDDSTYAFSYMPKDSGTYDLTVRTVDYCHRTSSSEVLRLVVPYNNTPLDFTIARIQSNTPTTPFPGWRARIRGAVTQRSADSSAFWVQNRDADPYQSTSDGIKVLVDTYAGACQVPAVGDSVVVVGTIAEVAQGEDGDPVTCLMLPDTVSVVGFCGTPGHADIIGISGGCAQVSEARSELERLEGMLVRVTDAIVVGPTDASNCAVVVTSRNRWPGSGYNGFGRLWTTEESPGCVDYNAERIVLDLSALPSIPGLHVWDTVRTASGVLDYVDGEYRIIVPNVDSMSTAGRPNGVAPVSQRMYPTACGSIRITTLDLGGLYDTIDDPGDDSVVTAAEYSTRMAKLRHAVIDEMLLPNILAVQGVEKPAVLAQLAEAVNREAGAHYRSVAYETADSRGLDCGFMWDTVEFELVESYLLNGPLIDSTFTNGAIRCAEPLMARFRRNWLMLNLISLDLVDRSARTPLLGSHVPFLRPNEDQRQNQALAVRDYINGFIDEADWQYGKVGVLGTLNDLRFTEDTEGATAFDILCGSINEVPLADIAHLSRPTTEWYSNNVNGNTELLTVMLLSPSLMDWAGQVDILHFNAPYAVTERADSTTGIRSADSDAIELRW